MSGIAGYEEEQVEQANASGRTAVVFVHGLWLLPSSWDRWRTVFEEAGYATLAPGWPDDPEFGRGGQEASRGHGPQVDRPDRRSLQ